LTVLQVKLVHAKHAINHAALNMGNPKCALVPESVYVILRRLVAHAIASLVMLLVNQMVAHVHVMVPVWIVRQEKPD